MDKILVVEDSLTTQALIQSTLNNIGQITCVASILDAEKELKKTHYDLIILDVLLPDGDGFELCDRIRKSHSHAETPLIFLTGRSEIDDKVRGLKLGGDDYVSKPFSPVELEARVLARLRRKITDQSPVRIEGFRVDFNTQTVFYQNHARTEVNLDLTRIEFKLLIFFMRNMSQLFSRADLLKKVWGENTHVSEHTVDTHISSLRKKIAMSPYQVKSVVKQGYKFEQADKEEAYL